MPFNKSALAVEDRFYTTNLGDLLLLKALGFIEDHHARILDVAENHLKLRVGNTFLERFFYRCSKERPVEITLHIRQEVDQEDSIKESLRLPGIACSQVDVTIVPQSRAWKKSEFEQFSRRILWSLRQHFISP